MKSEPALIFDLSPTTSLSSTLQCLLETSFNLFVPVRLQPIIACKSSELDVNIYGAIQRYNPALIFLVSSRSGLEASRKLLTSIKRIGVEIPIIAAVETCAPDEAFELLKIGAADFVTTPFQANDVLPRVWRLLRQSRSDRSLNQSPEAKRHSKKLIGISPVFLQEANKISLIAGCEANVLLVGETGTGKELYARAIHYGST